MLKLFDVKTSQLSIQAVLETIQGRVQMTFVHFFGPPSQKMGFFDCKGFVDYAGFGWLKFGCSKFYCIKYCFLIDLVHLVVIILGPLVMIVSLERSSFQFRSSWQEVIPIISELCCTQGASSQRQLVSWSRHKCASPRAPRRTTNCWPEWSRGSSQVSPPSRLIWRAWTVESKLSPARTRGSERALGICDLDV